LHGAISILGLVLNKKIILQGQFISMVAVIICNSGCLLVTLVGTSGGEFLAEIENYLNTSSSAEERTPRNSRLKVKAINIHNF
jgi:hypothetical protein